MYTPKVDATETNGSRNKAFEEDGDIEEVQVQPDGTQISKIGEKISQLNVNDYATRKTLAQGMLDLALLTANASQLKRILTSGPSHQFYYFLLTLIIISISLQMMQAAIMCILAIVFDIEKVEEQRRANIANNILLIFTTISVSVNIIISSFDIADVK